MLCPHCSGYVTADDIVCPECGAPVDVVQEEESGVQAIRQGRRARAAASMQSAPTPRRTRRGASRVYIDPEADEENGQSIPLYGGEEGVLQSDSARRREQALNRAPRREAYKSGNANDRVRMPGMEAQKRKAEQEKVEQKTWNRFWKKRRKTHWKKEFKPYDVKKRAINWVKVIIALIACVILCIVGFFVFLNNTATGQRMLVRWGRESTSLAVWEVGEEEMDVGNIDGAIAYFEQARAQDGEENINVNGLLLLGSAYEASGRINDAELLYTELYQNIVPTRSEPYTNVIRIMLADGRQAEAAELMVTAYEKTGMSTFMQQRSALLPQTPVVDLLPGLYDQAKTFTLSSPQNYDVYYTTEEEAVLPQDGTLVTGPITLDEGIYTVRAVAVSDTLVSDQFSGTYKIILPSPQSPKSSLAPDTYERRQKIRLRPGDDNKNDTDITIYYTIDGSEPTADSPIYTGEAFYLPTGGYVTLRAVAVNGYGKVSNELKVLYKIACGPYPEPAWTVQEGFGALTLYTTKESDFFDQYGEPKASEDYWVAALNAFGKKYTYDWGYIVTGPKLKETVLTELYYTEGAFTAPRGVGIGSTEEQIVGKFLDMGQVVSPSGNRGLYETTKGTGKIVVTETGKEIRYTTPTAESHTWCMTFALDTKGVCQSVHWYMEQ